MKLHDCIGIIIRPKRYIIQYSPIRTGSTLIYNVIRECLPEKTIKKTHTYEKRFDHLNIISTIRHPLDCLASILRIKDIPIDEKSIAQAITEFDACGLDDLIRIKDQTNTLLFKYADFTNDLNPVFENLESRFQIEIPYEKREYIRNAYTKEKMAAISTKLGSFSNWDPVTKVHGNHISNTHGIVSYEEVFTQDHIQYLKRHYRGLMDQFCYE